MKEDKRGTINWCQSWVFVKRVGGKGDRRTTTKQRKKKCFVGASRTGPSGWMSCHSHQRTQVYSCWIRMSTAVRSVSAVCGWVGQVREGPKDHEGGAIQSANIGRRRRKGGLGSLYVCVWMFLCRVLLRIVWSRCRRRSLGCLYPECWWWHDRPSRKAFNASSHELLALPVWRHYIVECGREKTLIRHHSLSYYSPAI